MINRFDKVRGYAELSEEDQTKILAAVSELDNARVAGKSYEQEAVKTKLQETGNYKIALMCYTALILASVK